jgi:hypothetical protein
MHLVLDGRLSPSLKQGMMAPFFAVLGISVGVIADGVGNPGASKTGERTRREAYQADVCYVAADDLMLDFAGDRQSSERADLRQPETVVALIDDIDTVLIDAVVRWRGRRVVWQWLPPMCRRAVALIGNWGTSPAEMANLDPWRRLRPCPCQGCSRACLGR